LLVETALGTTPADLSRQIRNLAVVVENESLPGYPVLFGLYVGVPLTERGQWYAGVQTDRITICRLPILHYCHTREEVVAQVAKTLVHEVGHYFGISDERLY
jgi:predicted Zn-dependent protease with MMP-like domain